MTKRVAGLSSRGLLDGTVELEGNLALLIWFEGRIQQVAPIREPIRRAVRFPGAYVRPRDDVEAARLITREPAESVLDPEWTLAWQQRERLLMMRVAAGEPHPEF